MIPTVTTPSPPGSPKAETLKNKRPSFKKRISLFSNAKTASPREAQSEIKLCVTTWNLGNAQPFSTEDSLELPQLFPPGFDIFVLGLQESRYKVGTSSPNELRAPSNLNASTATNPNFLELPKTGTRHLSDSDIDAPMSPNTDRPSMTNEAAQEQEQKQPKTKIRDNSFRHLDALLEAHARNIDMSLVTAVNLLQIRLLVFVDRKHVDAATVVRVKTVATGVGGMFGNKGGAMAVLRLYDTTLGFVGCHLAAHLHHLTERHENICAILKSSSKGKTDISMEVDHLFWFGDMNYRIDLSYRPGQKPEKVSPESDDFFEDYETVVRKIKAKRYKELLEFDQLTQEHQIGNVLSGFQIAPVNFAPTFKVIRHIELGHITYNDQRIPSWCDRVLWKSMPSLLQDVRLVSFESVPMLRTSDHIPVQAKFEVKLYRQVVNAGRLPRLFAGTSLYFVDIGNLQLIPTPEGPQYKNAQFRVQAYGHPNLTQTKKRCASHRLPRTQWSPDAIWPKDSFELEFRGCFPVQIHVMLLVEYFSVNNKHSIGSCIVPFSALHTASHADMTLPLTLRETKTEFSLRFRGHSSSILARRSISGYARKRKLPPRTSEASITPAN
eukprot:c17928_g1_i1.p1 GENE.c17928_g1_i1~~c17928_g1_i1.p1  ORF type:complete len:608 (+),score=81.53 c17928_g1_i1:33-1856(+)